LTGSGQTVGIHLLSIGQRNRLEEDGGSCFQVLEVRDARTQLDRAALRVDDVEREEILGAGCFGKDRDDQRGE